MTKLSVYPDCVIEPDGTRPRMLLDAKYKGHVEKGQLRISEADIYEALAFATATNCHRVVLAYPALPGVVKPAGETQVFEKVEVDRVLIVGVQVETRAISKVGGLKLFSSNFANGISAVWL